MDFATLEDVGGRPHTPQRFLWLCDSVTWFRQRASLLVENYVLLDYLPQFPKYRLSIIAMYTTKKQFRALADIALIVIGPINNVLVAISDLLNV